MTTADTRQHSIGAVCEALGVPRGDWRLFSSWAANPLAPKSIDALYAYVDVMIADRCRRSTDDLVSKLIELEVDGDELTVDDIRRFVAALVIRGGRADSRPSGNREVDPRILARDRVIRGV